MTVWPQSNIYFNYFVFHAQASNFSSFTLFPRSAPYPLFALFPSSALSSAHFAFSVFCFSNLFHLFYFVSTFPIFCCFFYSLFFPRFATFPPCSLFPSFLCLVSVPSSAPLLSLLLPFHFAPSAAASASPSAFLALPLLSTPETALIGEPGIRIIPTFPPSLRLNCLLFFGWIVYLVHRLHSLHGLAFSQTFHFLDGLFHLCSIGHSVRPSVRSSYNIWNSEKCDLSGKSFFQKSIMNMTVIRPHQFLNSPLLLTFFRCDYASPWEIVSVRRSVGP